MRFVNLKKFDCYRMPFYKPRVMRRSYVNTLLAGFKNGERCIITVSARDGETLSTKTKCVRTYVERMVRQLCGRDVNRKPCKLTVWLRKKEGKEIFTLREVRLFKIKIEREC